MASFTEAINRTTTEDLLCKTGSYAAYQKLLVSAVNIPLSITAFLGNILIIIALSRVSSLRPPSKLLLGCLASTDLCVGLITQPLFVAYIMSPEHSMLCYYFSILFTRLSITLGGVSVSTLTAISVDRLLALLLRLRYKHVVTLRRVQSYVVIIWIFSIVNTLTSSYDPRITRSITFSATILCIVTSIFSYTKIYLTLRSHQAQVQGHAHQGQPNGGVTPQNITRYRRTVSSALWIQTTLVVCYLPYGIAAIFFINGSRTQFLHLVWELALSLFMLNSTLNPLLYCWKIKGIRQVVMDMFRRYFCFST